MKYSEFLDAMKEKLIGKYKIRTGLGQDDFLELSNIYLISDGGYLEWPETICGYPYSSIPVRYKFSGIISGFLTLDVVTIRSLFTCIKLNP